MHGIVRSCAARSYGWCASWWKRVMMVIELCWAVLCVWDFVDRHVTGDWFKLWEGVIVLLWDGDVKGRVYAVGGIWGWFEHGIFVNCVWIADFIGGVRMEFFPFGWIVRVAGYAVIIIYFGGLELVINIINVGGHCQFSGNRYPKCPPFEATCKKIFNFIGFFELKRF